MTVTSFKYLDSGVTDEGSRPGMLSRIAQTFIRSGQNQLARHSEVGKKTRLKKRCEDNIREWTGLEFAKFQRAAKKRGKRKNLVVKSSVVLPTTPAIKV